MNSEIYTVVVLMAVTLLIYYVLRMSAGVKLNVYGMVLIWPVVLAIVHSWSRTGTVLGAVSAVIGMALLVRKSSKGAEKT